MTVFVCLCGIQISCVSSSTALRNRLRYPFYFQLLSTEETLAFAYYGAIKEYGWRKLALIVQNENLFTVVSGWDNGNGDLEWEVEMWFMHQAWELVLRV